MLHIVVLGVIEEDPVVCSFAKVLIPPRTSAKIAVSKRSGPGLALLARILSNSKISVRQKVTDLLIIPLELLQDMLARIRIMDQGISLRTVNELEVPRSWLAEYRLWRHFLVAEREGFSH